MPLYNPSSGGVSDGGTLSTGLTFPVAGLHILDTNGSHDLIVSVGSDLAADRTLTLTTGDADRTLTLSGNPTLSDWFDQSVKVAASPQFAAIELGHASDTTLTRTGAGVVAIEGVEIVTVSATQTLTNKTLTSPTISGAMTFPDNVRQTFNPGADAAGINVGAIAGDPGTPSNGDLWYDSTANELTARIAGANVALGAGGGGGLSYFTEAQSTSSPNGTVYVSSLTASGGATNIDAAIVPKAAGAFLAAIPDGTTAGGNKRGANAVDLQTYGRTNAAQVASGTRAGVLGGSGNTASGSEAVVVNGSNNTASATRSVVLNGSQATASATFSTVINGTGVSDHYGETVFSGTIIAAYGDAQSSRVHWLGQTTNNTQAEAFLDNSSARFTVASDVTYGFEIHVVARRTDADGESAYWIIRGCIDNNAGTTALVGSIAIDTVADDSAGAWSVTAEADNTNDALVVKVTGATSKTLNWTAAGHMIKVKG